MAFKPFDSSWGVIDINDETKYKTVFQFNDLIVKKRVIQHFVFLLFIDTQLKAKLLYKHSWEYQFKESIKDLINNNSTNLIYYLEYKKTNFIKIIKNKLIIDYSLENKNIKKIYRLNNDMNNFLNSLL